MNIIVAVCNNNGIGYKNSIPWLLRKDLKRFKDLTENNVVIMGKKTYQSIPNRPLKNRINIVLSRSGDFIEGATVCNDLEHALRLAKIYKKKIFIIGGESVYKNALKHKDIERIYYTEVKDEFLCDTFFPAIPSNFKNISEPNEYEENGIRYEYKIFDKF